MPLDPPANPCALRCVNPLGFAATASGLSVPAIEERLLTPDKITLPNSGGERRTILVGHLGRTTVNCFSHGDCREIHASKRLMGFFCGLKERRSNLQPKGITY